METLELSATDAVTIQIPKALAEQIERGATEHHTDVPSFLDRTLRAYEIMELEKQLLALRPDTEVTEEMQQMVESWVHEVRSEISDARRH